MQKVKCVNKIRDNRNGKIIGYTIQSSTGETKDVDKDKLKEAVRNGKVNIVNMTLTSDNRLVDKKVKVITSSNDRRAVEDIKQLCKTLRLPFDVNKIEKGDVSGLPVITYVVSDVPFGVDTVGIHISRVNNKEWDLSLDMATPEARIWGNNKDAWIDDVRKTLAMIPKRGQKPSVKDIIQLATKLAPYSHSLIEESYVCALFGYAEKAGQRNELSRYINSVKKQLNTEGVHKVIDKYIDKLEESANPDEVNGIADFPMTSDDVILAFALFGFDTEFLDKNPKISGSTLEQKVASALNIYHGDLLPEAVDITLCTARKFMML